MYTQCLPHTHTFYSLINSTQIQKTIATRANIRHSITILLSSSRCFAIHRQYTSQDRQYTYRDQHYTYRHRTFIYRHYIVAILHINTATDNNSPLSYTIVRLTGNIVCFRRNATGIFSYIYILGWTERGYSLNIYNMYI